MLRRRILLLLKPFSELNPSRFPRAANPQILSYLDDRRRVHKDTINSCQDVLRGKPLDWEPVSRDNLCQPIRHVDLVVTIGGDGTLLRASHFMDDSIPILGVNSDPTKIEEVEELSSEFDARRSTGHLCAATAGNFEQVLDEILEGHKAPVELSRILIRLNGNLSPTYALNDVLVAHPCPAALSQFSFLLRKDCQMSSSLVNCRSSGLRVSTAAGSTAAMLSAGGFPMHISCKDLQYMVREPILPTAAYSKSMHGLIKYDESMHATWYSNEGAIYIDGSHVCCPIQVGDTIEISSKAPILKVFLPPHVLE